MIKIQVHAERNVRVNPLCLYLSKVLLSTKQADCTHTQL